MLVLLIRVGLLSTEEHWRLSHHATLAVLDKLNVDHDGLVKRWRNVLTRNLNSNVSNWLL